MTRPPDDREKPESDAIDVETFQREARVWLARNVPPLVDGQDPYEGMPADEAAQHSAQLQRMLFEGGFVADLIQNWDVSPDGESFVAVLADPERPREIRIVENWFQELTERVPVP